MQLIEQMRNTIGGQLRSFVEHELSAGRVDMFSNSITSRKLVLPRGTTKTEAQRVALLIETREWNGASVKKVIVRTCAGSLNGGKLALTVRLNYVES